MANVRPRRRDTEGLVGINIFVFNSLSKGTFHSFMTRPQDKSCAVVTVLIVRSMCRTVKIAHWMQGMVE